MVTVGELQASGGCRMDILVRPNARQVGQECPTYRKSPLKNRLFAILVLLIPVVCEYVRGYCVPRHLRIADTLQHE